MDIYFVDIHVLTFFFWDYIYISYFFEKIFPFYSSYNDEYIASCYIQDLFCKLFYFSVKLFFWTA